MNMKLAAYKLTLNNLNGSMGYIWQVSLGNYHLATIILLFKRIYYVFMILRSRTNMDKRFLDACDRLELIMGIDNFECITLITWFHILWSNNFLSFLVS